MLQNEKMCDTIGIQNDKGCDAYECDMLCFRVIKCDILEENMRKLIWINNCLAALIMLTIVFTIMNFTKAEASDLGYGSLNQAGTVTWRLNSEGVLTVDGDGIPDSYASSNQVPWDTLRDKIVKVQFNNNVTGVKNISYWFSGCENLVYMNQFPENTTYMKYTFEDCRSLESIPVIPMKVKTLFNCFKGCSSLKEFPKFDACMVENWSYAFKGCTGLEYASLILSYPVTSIKGIFQNCKNLDALVVFNDTKRLTAENSAKAFLNAGCGTERRIRIVSCYMSMNKVKNLLNATYETVDFCGELKNSHHYKINDGKKCSYAYIEETGILYIAGKGNVDMSQVIQDMKDYSDKIKQVVFGNSIKKISKGTFKNFKSITNIELPVSLEAIPDEMFSGCESLGSIILPAGLKLIGERAFADCINLRKLYIPDEIEGISGNAFENLNDTICLEFSNHNKTALEAAKDNNYHYKIPEQLSVEYTGNVTEGCLLIKENFTAIRLIYSDGDSVDIPYEEIIVGDYIIEAGDNVIQASYGDFSTSFNVTGVEKAVVRIEVNYDSDSDAAVEGGKISADSLSVLAEFDNGKKEYLKYGGITGESAHPAAGYYTIDDYKLTYSLKGEENPVTVRVCVTSSSDVSKTAVIYVPASKKSVIGISAYYAGSDITEGMGINPENIVAYANFNNNTKERILFNGVYNTYNQDEKAEYTIVDPPADINDSYDVSTEYTYSVDSYVISDNNNLITIWCGDQSATFIVRGKKKLAVGIEAEYTTEGIEDGTVDRQFIKVYIKYDNGDREELEQKDNIFVNEEILILGDNHVCVSYIEPYTRNIYKCSMYVSAREKKPVELVKILPAREPVIEGEWMSEIEWNVSIRYDNGRIYDSITKLNIPGCFEKGENNIHVSYMNLDGEITVSAEEFIPVIKDSKGDTPPAVIEKNSNIKLWVSGNSTNSLKDKKIEWHSSNPDVISVSDTGMLTANGYGTAVITAVVNGEEAKYEIEVQMPAVKSIYAEYEGEVLEETQIPKDNIKVFLVLENDDTIALQDLSSVELENDYIIKEGSNEVKLYYTEEDSSKKYECIMNVTGKKKTPVAIQKIEQVKKNIVQGEPLNSIEFNAEVLFDNGKIENVIIHYDGSGDVTYGSNTVEISYFGVKVTAGFEAERFVPVITLDDGGTVPEKLKTGDMVTLKVNGNSEDALVNKQILWRSSDENVMSVDKDGVVTVKHSGHSDITAIVNGECVKVTIYAEDDCSISSIVLNKSATYMIIGSKLRLKYTIPEEFNPDELKWSSGKPSIAVVSRNGLVTAKSVGNTTIKLKAPNGVYAKCKIYVRKSADRIILNKKIIKGRKGQSFRLKYRLPDNSYVSGVKWYSVNKKIATVSSKGVVCLKKKGVTFIRIKADNGVVAKCKIKVLSKK